MEIPGVFVCVCVRVSGPARAGDSLLGVKLYFKKEEQYLKQKFSNKEDVT